MFKIYHDYQFTSQKYQNIWHCITSHTFENMELYYRKKIPINKIWSTYRKAFNITPITLKTTTDKVLYKHKILSIYLLCHYSNEELSLISSEFNMSLSKITTIATNDTIRIKFQDEIKSFFKILEEEFLLNRRTRLALTESDIAI